jgi:hypothetical protein
MTVATPTPTELLSSAVRGVQEAYTLAAEQVNRMQTLLGQVRAQLTTALEAAGSTGGMPVPDLQGILDMISQTDEDLRVMAADAATAVQSNQPPGTTPGTAPKAD